MLNFILKNKKTFFGRYVVAIDTFLSDRVLQKIFEFNEKAILNFISKKTFKPIEISGSGLELMENLDHDGILLNGEWYSDSEIKIDKK